MLPMLCSHYQEVIDKLSDVERRLLAKRIADLQHVLDPGFDPLNWTSLNIIDFVETCERAIAQFDTLVMHVHKTGEQIRTIISKIRSSRLVDVTGFRQRDEVLSTEDLVDRIERHRLAVVDDLVKRYQSIGPLLIIVEQQVHSSPASAVFQFFAEIL